MTFQWILKRYKTGTDESYILNKAGNILQEISQYKSSIKNFNITIKKILLRINFKRTLKKNPLNTQSRQ